MSETNLKFSAPIHDALHRPLRSLRISVTDRCNLRCRYCMPEEEYTWLRRDEILSFEEVEFLAEIFASLGVEKVRLTGGEPLLRHNLPQLVKLLAANPHLRDLALTTNGLLLAREAGALREAGLHRITVSLDTLRPERFQALARSASHAAVIEGLKAAREAGFQNLKINAVIMRGFNDDELADLIEFGRRAGAEVRFIEYMDVGGATRWSMDQVVTRAEMLQKLERHFGLIQPAYPEGQVEVWAKAPAEQFRLADGSVFGIISSTTQPFCRSCARSRLTTDGIWFLCLYAAEGVDLRKLLRGGAPRHAIARSITEAWQVRTDRGAEERLGLRDRGALFPVEELRKDPHREMHTRGG
ncbi:MAG TPA: GTP 3',8-cyclase MoaA [Terriglobia bacterium]|nr:GTP 3',8-cyclase MoaA [Terriglobia bacterium]